MSDREQVAAQILAGFLSGRQVMYSGASEADVKKALRMADDLLREARKSSDSLPHEGMSR